MADLKYYLDYEGLKFYDEKIKDLIGNTDSKIEDLKEALGLTDELGEGTLLEILQSQIQEVDNKVGDISQLTSDTVVNLAQALEAELERAAQEETHLQEQIDILNGDAETEGSVAHAIAKVVDSAPETLDTLKEVADWISNNGEDAVNLVTRVAENESKIEDLKEYVDAQDEKYYNSINAISKLKVMSLFPVAQQEDETALDAINNISEGEAIKLLQDQIIAEDFSIEKSCYIDANGATFEGTITIPSNVDVIIENATFSKPIVVA